MQSFLIADSSSGSDSFVFRGGRDYIHSSDFLGFIESALEPRGRDLKVRIDFLRPIRSHVRLVVADQLEQKLWEPPLAMVGVDSDSGIHNRYSVLAEPHEALPGRKEAFRGVVDTTYHAGGYCADVSSRSLQSFLYDIVSCMKIHWQTFHSSKDKIPLVRRVEINLPFTPPNHIEGCCQPLKLGAQRWSFKEQDGNRVLLNIDCILLSSSPQ